MDGRSAPHPRRRSAKSNLYAFEHMWDNGYRQITSSTHPIKSPDDLKGFKIRVPVSPLWTSMFKAFGALPASININEAYSAMQTKIVEGQENPLALIDLYKFYEVQKFVSLTNHMWDGFWTLANGRLGGAAQGPAGDHRAQPQRSRHAGARGRGRAQCIAAGRAQPEGHGLQQDRRGEIPRRPAQGRLLRGVEGEIRRRGLGRAGEPGRWAQVDSAAFV